MPTLTGSRSPLDRRWGRAIYFLPMVLLCSALAAVDSPPLSPAEAKLKFKLETGYKIELVLAEPWVESPCVLAWDEAERLYVVENRGYPAGAKDGSPQGRIARFEPGPTSRPSDLPRALNERTATREGLNRTDFATDLMFPNGILPWRGGLLVTDAPHLYWLSDTNEDGHADQREIWFTGFATNQSTQLRACYPTLGADGWIYVARGWSGGIVTSPKWTHLPPVDLKDGDFRFRPDGSAAEAIGGNAQFGLVLDDVGRRFLVSNRNPLIHAVADPRWWKRVLWLPFTDVVQDVAPVGADAVVHPLSPDLTTAGFMVEFMAAPHAGSFTSACGIHQYFGEALGLEMQGSWFVCEPAQNLVQRQIAIPDGPTFRSRPIPEDRDFLASSDPWFHPVSVWTGPDGALYLADMYRKFIDHPEYLPEDVRPKLDFDSGKNMGRIWRIVATNARVEPPGAKPNRETARRNLASLNVQGLVDTLEKPNIWARETAHRLLLERNAADVVTLMAKALERVLTPRAAAEPGEKASQNFASWARLRQASDPATGPHLAHARMLRILFERVAVLAGPEKVLRVSEEVNHRIFGAWLSASLAPSPSLREAAWRVMQPISDEHNPIPDVGGDLLRIWVDDPSPAVRFHLAYCLGQGDYRRMTEGLVEILRRDPSNRWTRAIVLSGLKQRQTEFLRAFFARKNQELPGEPAPSAGFTDSPGLIEFASELGRMFGAGGNAELLWTHAFSASAQDSIWQLTLLKGLSQSVRQRGGGDLARLPLIDMAEKYSPSGTGDLLGLIDRVSTNVLEPVRSLAWRTNAIAFLAELNYERIGATLLALLTPAQPKETQLAAARGLAQFNSLETARALSTAERWSSYTPPIRELVMNGLLSQPQQLPALLDAIEEGSIPTWAIPANRRKQLGTHRDAAIKERAAKLFGGGGDADRRKIYDEFKPILNVKGESQNGRAVFLRVCASCHQHGGEGAPVGPDLTGVKNQPPEALLLHILVPDAEIYSGYESYECETKDGRSLGGLLIAETATSVTLRRALGEQDVVPRQDIVSLKASRVSLMPSELEKAMSQQELADLLAFLRGR